MPRDDHEGGPDNQDPVRRRSHAGRLASNMRRLELSPVTSTSSCWPRSPGSRSGMDGLVRGWAARAGPILIHPEFWSRRRIAFPGRDPISCHRRASPHSRAPASRSWRSANPRSSSTARCWSRARSTARASSNRASRSTRPTGTEAGSPIPDPRRPSPGGPRPRPRPGDPHRLRPLRHRQHPPLRAKADRREPHPRRARRLPSQRTALEKIIAPICQALDEFSPDHLVPAHCTGWRATHALAARFPEAFIQNSVGTRFEFASAN